MSSVNTGADGWPSVKARLGLRRYSLTIHTTVNLAALVVLLAATLLAGVSEKVSVGSLVANSWVEIATAGAAARAQPSAEKKKTNEEKREDNWLKNFNWLAGLMIVGVLLYETGAYYQMKQAVHDHHTDIDKIVIPERTKCRGDSKAEPEEKKKLMTDILESHQIRDYRDTWKLLNRQLLCASVTMLLVLGLLIGLALSDVPMAGVAVGHLMVLFVAKALVAGWGLWIAEAQRRVFPWRDQG